MVKIKNLEEKRLIVARYFILQKNKQKEFTEHDVYYMWNNYFPSDFRTSKNHKFKLHIKDGKSHLTFAYNDISKEQLAEYTQIWHNIYYWFGLYVENHTLEVCDKDIAKIRRKHENYLKCQAKSIWHGAKMVRATVHKPASYTYFKKGFSRCGDYEQVLEWIEEIKEEQKTSVRLETNGKQ
jgi:hypothetical protein